MSDTVILPSAPSSRGQRRPGWDPLLGGGERRTQICPHPQGTRSWALCWAQAKPASRAGLPASELRAGRGVGCLSPSLSLTHTHPAHIHTHTHPAHIHTPCTYTHTPCTYTHTHTHMCTCSHTQTVMPIHTHDHTHLYAYIHTHLYTYTYTPIYTHTHSHTYIHTPTHAQCEALELHACLSYRNNKSL